MSNSETSAAPLSDGLRLAICLQTKLWRLHHVCLLGPQKAGLEVHSLSLCPPTSAFERPFQPLFAAYVQPGTSKSDIASTGTLQVRMPGFLDLPVELRIYVYDILLGEDVVPKSRGVMAVTEAYVKHDLPLRCYRGLLSTCRQINYEVKQAIQHMVVLKQLNYDLNITFSHGRPYFSLTWLRFPALSPTINNIHIDVDLRTQEPFASRTYPSPYEGLVIPDEHELALLIEEMPNNFAIQLFLYIRTLLTSLAKLLSSGSPHFRVLYTECITLNLRTPTEAIGPPGQEYSSYQSCRRLPVVPDEARELLDTMQDTLRAESKQFLGMEASKCDALSPLIQVGSLRFMTEGVLCAEGYNLVLPCHVQQFHWLKY